MYNEEKSFSIKNIIIQFLFIALFVFILIWLFPLKSDLEGIESCRGESCNVSLLYDRIFNENILMMKDSAKSYYTTSRLPKKIGDKTKITLGEMLDLKIILPFVDKNGDVCSLTDSYVEITKYDEEFVMKVNLKCGSQENYLLVYMGCYDYCSTTICEKNKEDIKTPVIYTPEVKPDPKPEVKPDPKPEVKPDPKPEVKPDPKPEVKPDPKPEVKPDPKPEVKPDPKPEVKPDPKPEVKPDPKPVEKEYLYEYSKVTEGYYKYSDWSEWQTAEVKADTNTSVKIKTVLKKKLIGYNVTTTVDKNKPIYGTKEVQIGTKEEKVCVKYDYVATGEISYGEYEYVKTVYLTYTPTDTATTKYVYAGEDPDVCANNCEAGTTKAYKVYERKQTAVTEYKCVEETTKSQPVTTTIQVITGYETVETKEPVYETTTVKYYSYMTRTWVEGTKDIKWSIKNDTTLLSQGYSYTGNVKEK